MNFPDALLLEDLIVYPQAASRGYALTLPDLRQARPAVLNEFTGTWENFLNDLPANLRLQCQMQRSPNFASELSQYAARTRDIPPGWSRRVREERHARYFEQMRKGELLREQTVLFFSVPLEPIPHLFSSPFGLEDRYRELLRLATQDIGRASANLSQLLARHGGHLTAFNDADHHRTFANFLNPSLVQRPEFDSLTTFDPERSVQTNCWWSEATGTDFGFAMDGNYHSLRVFSRWPRRLDALTLQPVWKIPGGNFRVTVNLRFLDNAQVIRMAERQLRRLEGQYETERKPSLLPTIEKLRKRIEKLAGRFLRSLKMEVLIHTWARSREELAGLCAASEQAIQGCGGKYFAPTLPTTSKRLWAQSWPGYPWGSFAHYQLYTESTFAPSLLPLSASFTGYAKDAEALFESPKGSLVGLRTSSGGQPQHFVCIAGTGFGKSMLLQELISQIWYTYGLISVIDYGRSHETLGRLLDPGSEPLVFRADPSFTINYLDTRGLPLTSDHVADVLGLVSLMAGVCDEARDRLRRAVIGESLKQLYGVRFKELEQRDPKRALDLARYAMTLRKRKSTGSDLLENFIDFRDWKSAHPEEAQAQLDKFSEGEVLAYLKNPDTRPLVVAIACAFLTPDEHPTHRELQQWLRLRSAGSNDPISGELATLLQDWCRGGEYGDLLDGVSTVSLDRRFLCWEMGEIDAQQQTLSHVARHLVQSQTWKQIYLRPRSERKFLLFEETSTFLDLPGSDALIRRAYEQARKFNTIIATCFQSYSRLRSLPIRASIMGNTAQFLLLKQDDPLDLMDLAESLGLPASVIDSIKQFPKPAEAGYADFIYFSRDTPHAVCGVARHIPSAEMFYATNSTPAGVDARRVALRNAPDLLAKIQQLTSKK